MEEYNLIINKPIEELLDSQKKFLDIHNTILYYGANVCVNLYQMAKQLELMKNSKAYMDAGFETFESYAEDCLGLKRSQVYNYIKVANRYSNDFLVTNSKLGITKLLVLSELDEPVIEKVIETVPVEDKSVNELKSLVDSLTKEKKDLEKETKKVSSDLKKEIKDLKAELKSAKEELKHKEIGEPLTIDDVEDDSSEQHYENLYEESLKDISEKQAKINELEEKVKELESISKKNVINSNPLLIEFKIKFGELQVMLGTFKHLMLNMSDDEKTKCKNALNTVLRGAIYE